MVEEEAGTFEGESWVWTDEPPSPDEVIRRLTALPDVYGVSLAEYVEYVFPFPARQKIEKEGITEYVDTWRLYMQVAGRIKMLNDIAERNGLAVEESHELLSTDPVVLRIGVRFEWTPEAANHASEGPVAITGGVRFGISKAKGGDAAWEKAETAARGRAIAAWGIGIMPGSGIASVEEMRDYEQGRVERPGRKPDKRDREEILESTRVAIEGLRQARNEDRDKLYTGIAAYVQTNLGVSILDGEDLDLTKLKDGQLTLLESNVNAQLTKEQAAY